MLDSQFLIKVKRWGKAECITFIKFNDLVPDLSDLDTDPIEVLNGLDLNVLKGYIVKYVQEQNNDNLF